MLSTTAQWLVVQTPAVSHRRRLHTRKSITLTSCKLRPKITVRATRVLKSMHVRRSQHRLNKPFAGNSTVRRRAPDGARFFCAVLTSSQQFLITFALEAGLHMSMAIPDFSQLQVIVVGDLMLDQYWFGPASRISPEAPVPVVRVTRNEARAGGAANVAMNLVSLGVKTTCCGVVGSHQSTSPST